MRTILILVVVGVVMWISLTLDATTISLMIGWGMGWLVVPVVAVPLLMVIFSLLKILSNSNNTVNYHISYADNSRHTTTNTAYINQAEPNRLGANANQFLTSYD